jgi:hypothetical protein
MELLLIIANIGTARMCPGGCGFRAGHLRKGTIWASARTYCDSRGFVVRSEARLIESGK